MKALFIHQHGPVANLKPTDLPRPSLQPGEVLVRVHASGINPRDVFSALGRFPDSLLPRTLGRDFAGRVEQGPSDLIGADVWGTGGDLGISRDGAHAEYLALPRQAVSLRPKSLSLEQAASAGVPFITAFSALFSLGRLQQGEWVIISGAAGAVGQAAIQLARARGASVVALVKDATTRWVFDSGQVQAIAQSDKGDLEAVVREATAGKGAQLALNGVGGALFSSLFAALAPSGRQVVYSTAGGREVSLDVLSFYRRQFVLLGLNTLSLGAAQCAAILAEIAPLFDSGALHPPAIGQRYSLADAPQAYAQVESGKGGKAVFILA